MKKSILIEKEEHYKLKFLASKLDRQIKDLINEAIIDLLKKYKEKQSNESGDKTFM